MVGHNDNANNSESIDKLSNVIINLYFITRRINTVAVFELRISRLVTCLIN